MSYIEWVASLLSVEVVWENIAFLCTLDWSLVEQMNWDLIPSNVYLCLDTGHLMLGSKNPEKTIAKILNVFGNRVKHLHIHENDLVHDSHEKPHLYLTPKFVSQITKGRTWIYEPPS
ncbi:MAG: hypothetical protein NUV52_04580 [Candidatus Roizmanbacteria bacterium]|nr:hypothetical protein [Candidatus Roizmanbacteria bacterium]